MRLKHIADHAILQSNLSSSYKLWQREQDNLLQPKGMAIQVLRAAEELPQEKRFDLEQKLTN
jgi:hypothetical protein